MGSFSHDGLMQNVGNVEAYPSQSASRANSTSVPQINAHLKLSGSDVELPTDVLIRAIEQEIIPRLMRAHRESQACELPVNPGSPRISQEEVDSFTAMVIEPAEDVLQVQIDSMRRRGISVETLYLELLTPVARRLGELWEQDLCSFSDVTIGLGRLHQVLRVLSQAFGESTVRPAKGLSILLMPCPGEQHSFGLAMVGEFFRRAGWYVKGSLSPEDPADMVSKENFDVIGLSMAADIFRAELAKCIQDIRRASINRSLVILVGGPAFLADPGLVATLQADVMAADGREAPGIVEALLAERRPNSSRGSKV